LGSSRKNNCADYGGNQNLTKKSYLDHLPSIFHGALMGVSSWWPSCANVKYVLWQGLTLHGMTMALGIYFVVMIGVIKGFIKLQFPNPKWFKGERYDKWCCTLIFEAFICI
jgi:hypothetical protein